MKNLLGFVFVFSALCSAFGGEVRYLSSNGDDAADGKTPATAWQAIVRDNDGKRCTFVSTSLSGRKG